MRILSFITGIVFLLSGAAFSQSPHRNSMKYDCSYCHQATDWKVIPAQIEFNHNETDFPLIGQHSSVSCRSCHKDLKFEGTSDNCSDCHKDIHMNSVGFDCARCHTSQNWIVKDITNIHRISRFPLLGVHLRADCAQCHNQYSTLNFRVEGITCFSCHQQDYSVTTNPNHSAAGFSTECQECHSINNENWSNVNFAHDFFPLTGGHKIANCFSCHQQGTFSGLSKECYSCHKTDFDQSTNPNHIQEGFSTDCSQCHNINAFRPSTFQHNQTEFPLTGKHINVDCRDCHTTGYTSTPAECYSCHKNDYDSTDDPNHLQAGFSTECSQCHTTDGWDDANFDHSLSGFPLTGSHVNASCSSCHQSGFTGTPSDCFSCHNDDFNVALNHASQNYPHDCTLCHNTNVWNQTNFSHDNTGFPLTGVHITTDCSSCHTSGFAGTPDQCVQCHQDDFNASINPSHTALSLSTACQDCHIVTLNWEPATFPVHNNYYVLEGAHLQIASNCVNCHNGNYTTTPNTCFGCHQDDYTNTNNPSHASAGFSTECLQCHTQNAWTPSTFDHTQFFPIYSGRHQGQWTLCSDCHTNSGNFSVFSCIDCHEHNKADTDEKHIGVSGYVYSSAECYACHPTGEEAGAFNHTSGFPLLGAHTTVSCTQCHQNGYSGTTKICYDCHTNSYASSSNPGHTTLGLSTECSNCHSFDPDWKPAQFPQHNQYFELTGRHLEIINDCLSCHNRNYITTTNECSGCHIDDFNNAQNPDHQSAGISTLCGSCHSASAWIPSSFNHNSTGFQLTGQHLLIQCSACHIGSTTGLDGACISCHQDNFNTAPNHVSQNYPSECSMCHNTSAWNQTSFDHASTNFPLTGGHINVNCLSCHQSGYSGTTTICVDCHQENYNSSTNPGHTALQLSTNCTTCHTTNPDWQPAAFPDHNNYYQLLGAHAALINNCSGCHNGNYNTTPNTCFGCHSDDYNSTTNPAHQTAGFPTECLSCHTQNVWTPSTFNHDGLYFPVYSGRHQGKWNLCSDCHTNPGNFTVFSCINCHEHNRTEMDQKHIAVSGYVYESGACLNCHPDGESKMKRPGMEIR